MIETQRSRVSVLHVSLSGQRKPLPPPMVCACEGGVSVHVCGREGCVVCACVGEERVSTHSNSNSLDKDTGICLHNHSGGENTNCHVTHDRTGQYVYHLPHPPSTSSSRTSSKASMCSSRVHFSMLRLGKCVHV